MLTNYELNKMLQQHLKLKQSFFTYLRQFHIIDIAIESWSKSNATNRQSHIDSLLKQRQMFEQKYQTCKDELMQLEQKLNSHNIKYDSFRSKIKK